MPEITEAYEWTGRMMVGSDGEKIGKVSEIYEDPATGKPEWATVNTGLFGTKSNFVPLAGASPNGEDVRASVTKAQVKDAPGVEHDGEHTDANVGDATDGPEISDEEHEVVLHEEEPVVEKRVVPKERVRMGKETVNEEREVSEQVREEQIESEGADTATRRWRAPGPRAAERLDPGRIVGGQPRTPDARRRPSATRTPAAGSSDAASAQQDKEQLCNPTPPDSSRIRRGPQNGAIR